MTTISEEVNVEIEALWDKWRKTQTVDCEALALRPLRVAEPNRESILFIGLNPSFNQSAWTRHGEILEPASFYACGSQGYCPEKDLRFDRWARENYPYFEKMQRIADQNKVPWEHIDLFFMRETSQKKLRACLSKMTEFATKQLTQSKRLIQASNPSVIVVANAYASGLYRELFRKELDSSQFDSVGYDHTRIQKKEVPTFFTSMLSGQRALDNGSFERLCWQIGQALKNEQGPGGQS